MQPEILHRSDHVISRKNIDEDALKVLYRLHRAGHTAYLVGGGVRDLMLSERPKDFDVSTSARPSDVKRLFRNCRLIGRRFRLAHILYGGGKVIEVSTFRRQAETEGKDLLVRRDNVFGTPEEDAERRDFTINALFYDIGTFAVIDHVGGLKDLESRTLRTIGEPAIRYQEDPIRMLRAVKFAARLNFQIADGDRKALGEYRSELLRAAPERLNLELKRLLGGGFAREAFKLLDELGLLEVLLPEVSRSLSNAASREALWRDLDGLDALAREHFDAGHDVPTPVLFATVLCRAVNGAPASSPRPSSSVSCGFGMTPHRGGAGGRRGSGALDEAAVEALLGPALQRLAVPRREGETLVSSLALQPKLLTPPARTSVARTLWRRHPALAEALLILDARTRGGTPPELLAAWLKLLPGITDPATPRPRRSRGGTRRTSGRSGEAKQSAEDAPKRPRRRRRRGGQRGNNRPAVVSGD